MNVRDVRPELRALMQEGYRAGVKRGLLAGVVLGFAMGALLVNIALRVFS